MEIAILVVAAFLAGILNAIAGGGSFLTFPALVFAGVPVIPANATSAVAVFPGYLSSTLGFKEELRSYDRRSLWILTILSILGGVLGALLLMITPSSLFNFIVPWLLLVATLLFAFDKPLRRWSQGEGADGASEGQIESFGKRAVTLVVTTYGGYFNGGLGIILLALFSGLGMRDMHVMNGLKNGLSFILSAASVTTLALAGLVYWQEAIIMMVAATIGGYAGAYLARLLPVQVVRMIVITVGFGMSVAFFMR